MTDTMAQAAHLRRKLESFSKAELIEELIGALVRAAELATPTPAPAVTGDVREAIKQIDLGYIDRVDGVTNEHFEAPDEALIFLNDDNEQTCHVEGPNAKAMAQQIVTAVRAALSVTRPHRNTPGEVG